MRICMQLLTSTVDSTIDLLGSSLVAFVEERQKKTRRLYVDDQIRAELDSWGQVMMLRTNSSVKLK